MPFNGPVIPFGAMVEYHPTSAKDTSAPHQVGPRVFPGKFLGYASNAGRIWKGDMIVADIEELEVMDTSEIHARRLNAKEVLTSMKGENFIFPISDGTVKISGEDQDLRTSTLIRENPDRGKEQTYRPGLLQLHDKTRHGMMVKPKEFLGLSREILFTVITLNPRVKLYSPREESFPTPLQYIDVPGTTDINLDVMSEKTF